MPMPLQYTRYPAHHPCHGTAYTVWHEYWHDPDGGRYWAEPTNHQH